MAKKIDLTGLEHFKSTENAFIAPVETSTTASQAHATGERFWLAGKLYIATANIASGGTITVGTNCALDVLGDDVSELKSAIDEITEVKNPLLFSPVSDKNVDISISENGSITISGTSNAKGFIDTDCKMELSAGTYFLTCKKISGTVKPTMYIHDGNGNNIFTYIAATGNTLYRAVLQTSGTYYVRFWTNNGDENNYTFFAMLSKSSPETFVKPQLDLTISDTVYGVESVVANKSSNVLKPVVLGFAYNGVTIDYNSVTGVMSFGGTATSNFRIIIGSITPETSGQYTLSYVNHNIGKPSMYVCQGDTIIGTWGQAYSTLTVTLTEGATYTLEAYLPSGSVSAYKVAIKCEYGTEAHIFEKYGYVPKVDLSSKKFSICGVSIDTYAGWIPSGNSSYYSSSNLASVNMTWWKKLMDMTGINLVMNNSWSSACASTVNGLTSSGVQRCLSLDDGTTNPDIIIVGMFGANDWANTTVGDYDFSTSIPTKDTDLTDADTYNTYASTIEKYSGAMATIFKRIHGKYPKARIYALDMYNYYRGDDLDPAGISESQNIPVFNKALYDVAEWFGVTVIKTSECGINAINSRDYCVDAGTGTALHPNDAGHTLIYKKVLSALKYDFA